MILSNSIALVTGANRGLGLALVQGLLQRGAQRVYAAARKSASLATACALAPGRVVPLELDVTRQDSIAAAAAAAGDVDLLVNNAGLLASFDVLEAEEDALRADMEVNYFGPLRLARAFRATLTRSSEQRGKAAGIVNVLSVVSLASMPALGGYSASKAAAHSLTQSLRGRERALKVFAAYPGPIDTDMLKAFDMPKTSPADVARGILEGVAADVLDIYPDAASQSFSRLWQADPRGLERQFAAGG